MSNTLPYYYDAEDHVHEWKLTKTLITPSCISDGEAEYTCKCGETKTEVIKASEEYHDYRKIRTLQAPTIDKVGIDVYECTYCKDTITKVVDALGCEHNYVVEYNHPSTCTKEGEKKEYCTKCGDEKVEKLPLADHVSSTPEGRGTITKPVVDCLVDGAEDVVCDECRQIFSRPISAHKYEKVSESPATCTAEGVVTYKCKVCNDTKVEVTDKLEHNYEVVSTTPATCTKNGVEVKACNLCGDVVSKVLHATGHVKPAKADQDDTNYALGFVEVDAKGKYVLGGGNTTDITGVTPATEADCTHDLVEVYWCTGCSSLQVEVVERKSGHVMDTSKDTVQGAVECDVEGNPIIVKDEEGNIVVTEGGKADCRHAEIKVFRCKNCGESEYTVITKKLNHTPLAGSVITYAPTCTEDGYRTYTCTTCPRGNQQVTEPTGVKATGHKYEYVAETCTEDACIKCANAKCEEKVVTTKAELDKLDATTKATIIKILTDNGFTATEAGDYELPTASGHDFTVGTAVKVTTVDGVTKYTLACADCGEDITVTLDNAEYAKATKATVDGKETKVAVDENGILRVTE